MPAVVLDMLTQYGQITMDHCFAYMATYNGRPVRASQASSMLALCLASSIGPDLYLKELMHQSEYNILDPATLSMDDDGLLMLKVLLSIVCIETRATVSCLRNELNDLPAKMVELSSDITAFNLYINQKVDALHASGEGVEDLLNKLFRAYLACEDEAFVTYIKEKENLWEDGTTHNLVPTCLMQIAEDKYKIAKVKGKWMPPPMEDPKYVAQER